MNFELVNEPLKTNQSTVIVDLEDTMVTIGKRSKIFPVVDSKSFKTVGYYLSGEVYLGADTIVNTSKGAVGSATEKLSNEAFVKCDQIDLSNTKSDSISEKEFRNIERQAYRYFEKMRLSKFMDKAEWNFHGKNHRFSDNLDDLEFLIYLFDPEEFMLIKNDDSLIAIGKDDREVIVCDKKKNSYVEVSKNQGIRVSNDKGEVVKTDSKNGLIINGKNISEIIEGAIRPVSEFFSKKKF
ncbi:MAG: hypothetical protein FK734_20950 [Asgard group archaeon]|nr:hypothetical protein [Asgard group archaeon]